MLHPPPSGRGSGIDSPTLLLSIARARRGARKIPFVSVLLRKRRKGKGEGLNFTTPGGPIRVMGEKALISWIGLRRRDKREGRGDETPK